MNGGIKFVAREIAQERRAHRMAMLNSRTSRVAVSVVTALAGMVVVVGSGRGSTTQASAAQLSPKRVGHAPSASGRAVRLGGLSGKTVLHVDVELSPAILPDWRHSRRPCRHRAMPSTTTISLAANSQAGSAPPRMPSRL